MSLYRFQHIENWTESDLPKAENETCEFKGSKISDNDLGNKISVAASAFWNSGGGIFIVGIDNNGKIDGGISETVGRQSRRDWIDQQIAKTQPSGKYWVNILPPTSCPSLTDPHNVIAVIAFGESFAGPHMAFDLKHYIRAGAHSLGANHFLVEAIRARKGVETPIIRALLRRSERKSHIIELAVVVLNDTSAIDVKIDFEPLPKALSENFADKFPLNIPFIDRYRPFQMDIFIWGLRSKTFGDQPVKLKVSYNDLLGRSYEYEQLVEMSNIDPMTLGNTDLENIEEALKKIAKKLK